MMSYLKFRFNQASYLSSGNLSQGVPVKVLRAEPEWDQGEESKNSSATHRSPVHPPSSPSSNSQPPEPRAQITGGSFGPQVLSR